MGGGKSKIDRKKTLTEGKNKITITLCLVFQLQYFIDRYAAVKMTFLAQGG